MLHVFSAASADGEGDAVVELDGILLERDRIGEIHDIAPMAAHKAFGQLGHEVVELGVRLELVSLAVNGDFAEVAAEVDDCGSVYELLLMAHLNPQHRRPTAINGGEGEV